MTAGDIAAQFQMAKFDQPPSEHFEGGGPGHRRAAGQNIVYCLNLTVFQELMKWFYDMGFAKGGENNEK